MKDTFLTLQEASERSRMSVSWWRAKILARRIEFVRVGRKIFIAEDTIERVLREGIVQCKEEVTP